MIAKVKNKWQYGDAYKFITSDKKYAKVFNEVYPPEEIYPPDEADDEDFVLFDRVLAHSSDEGDQSVIEAILEHVEGKYFVMFHQDHPNDWDGYYVVYEFE